MRNTEMPNKRNGRTQHAFAETRKSKNYLTFPLAVFAKIWFILCWTHSQSDQFRSISICIEYAVREGYSGSQLG